MSWQVTYSGGMTAQIIDLPTGGQADDTIRRTIAALMKGRGVSVNTLAESIGVSRAAWFSKMGGHGTKQAFKAGEVATIAQVLGVSVGQLYDGLGGTFLPPASEMRAWRDSNPQPSDPELVPAGNILNLAAWRQVVKPSEPGVDQAVA